MPSYTSIKIDSKGELMYISIKIPHKSHDSSGILFYSLNLKLKIENELMCKRNAKSRRLISQGYYLTLFNLQ